MTGQLLDTVAVDGTDFNLCAPWGLGRLFDIASIGLEPLARSTGCWRGFHCGFRVHGDQLHLHSLHCYVNEAEVTRCISSGGPIPRAFKPSIGRFEFFDIGWTDLQRAIPFSGALLLGAGKLPHDMTGSALWFMTVHEMVLEDGRVESRQDLSAPVAQFRTRWEALQELAQEGSRAEREASWRSGIAEMRRLCEGPLVQHAEEFLSWLKYLELAPQQADDERQRREQGERNWAAKRARYQRRIEQRPALQQLSRERISSLPNAENGASLKGECPRCQATASLFVHERDLLLCSRCLNEW